MTSWKKRIQTILCVLCACMMLAPLTGVSALAEDTEALDAALRQSIEDRCQINNVDISMEDKIAAENGINFTMMDYQFTTYSGKGDMCVDVYLNVTGTDIQGENFYLMPFDFVLVSVSEEDSSRDDMLLYTAEHMYDLTDGRYQEINWPIQLFEDTTISLCLTFVVPKTLLQFGFSESNLTGDNVNALEAAGPLYTLSFNRNPIDFSLYNNSSLEITKLYVAPTESTKWGDELLERLGVESIPADKWVRIPMALSTFADSMATSWTVKIEFSNDTWATFGHIDLTDTLSITLREDEESVYADIGS